MGLFHIMEMVFSEEAFIWFGPVSYEEALLASNLYIGRAE